MRVRLPSILQGRCVLSRKTRKFEPNMMARLAPNGLRVGRFGFCPCCCYFSTTIERVPQSTQYEDETANWFTGCQPCRDENEAYWRERWQEYYSGVL